MTPRQLLDLLALPLAIAKPASTLQMQQCLHIDGGRVTATNGESTVQVDLSGSDVLSGVAGCVNAPRLTLALNTLPPTESLALAVREGALRMTCGRSRRTLGLLPLDEFPLRAPIDEQLLQPVPKPRVLEHAITFLQPAVAPNEAARIMMRGINADGGALSASNGFSGHLIDGAAEAAGVRDGMIIPGTALTHLLTIAKAAADEPEKPMLAGPAPYADSDSPRAYVVKFGMWLLQFSLIGAPVLPMQRVVPREHAGTVFSASRRALAHAFRNMERLTPNGKLKPGVRLTLTPAAKDEGELTIELETSLMGGEEVIDRLAVDYSGTETWECGVNPEYIAEALEALNGETATCSQASEKAPVFITGCNPHERCVVQPMRN